MTGAASRPFDSVDHRPWPHPERPWAMAMRWSELLFLHRPLAPRLLEPLLPPALQLDTFEGDAWLGVVPFQMSGVRARGIPPVPGTSRFLELNLRTYVKHGGKPGVWFFSLDAASRLAVRGARSLFHLPYFDAEMSLEREGDSWLYRSERTHRRAPAAQWKGRYRATGPLFRSQPGSLEEWLTERYCLYAAKPSGQVLRGEIQHAPWPLQRAEAEIEKDGLFEQLGFAPDRIGTEGHLLFARGLTVAAWMAKAAID